MLNEKIEKELNLQMNRELYAAYLYFAMGAQFESQSFNGFAKWMKAQAAEEIEHAKKFYNQINERGGRAKLMQIDEPPFEWKSPLAAFEAAYEHEKKVTAHINDILKLSREQNDYATEVFLHWFVEEQVEEEEQTAYIVNQLELVGDSKPALIMMDRELGRREG